MNPKLPFKDISFMASLIDQEINAMARKINDPLADILFVTISEATTDLLHVVVGHSGKPIAQPANSTSTDVANTSQSGLPTRSPLSCHVGLHISMLDLLQCK